MRKDLLRGRHALVTGASSGLGADFARELAGRGADLTLVARREPLLRRLAGELAAAHGTGVEVVVCDLTDPGAPERLHRGTEGAGLPVDVLVNNAGYGLYGHFAELDWERQRNMLELDVLVPVHLTKLFLPGMLGRGFGFVLNLASIGAYQPSPRYAVYSAAKSFVLSFTEALSYELRGTGVSATALSPGIVATEFLRVSGQQATRYQRLAMMRSPTVARIGVDAMLKGRPSLVAGRLNAASAWSNRLLPRRLSVATADRLMR
ncbi:MAG TPA: SDR family oxidoreductase [Actinomycetes bacterium]|nr:SDR family oxidoreductase [Actinomycetes bacterium]